MWQGKAVGHGQLELLEEFSAICVVAAAAATAAEVQATQPDQSSPLVEQVDPQVAQVG
jgi:hypothetical protein